MRYRVALYAMFAIMALGIVALVWSDPSAGPRAGIDAIRFDTTGWNRFDVSLSSMMWKNADGDVLELKWVPAFANMKIDGDIAAMRDDARRLASNQGGSLVSAELIPIAGRTAGALIYKREQLPAYDYIGMLFVQNDADRFIFSLVSKEGGTTGVRDALVTARLVELGKLDPRQVDENRRVKGWFVDPYDVAFSASTIASVADADEYDPLTPSHPLTKVRAALRSFQRTIAFP